MTDDGSTAICVGHGQRHTAAVGSVHFGQLSCNLLASAGQDSCIKIWSLPPKWDIGRFGDPII